MDTIPEPYALLIIALALLAGLVASLWRR